MAPRNSLEFHNDTFCFTKVVFSMSKPLQVAILQSICLANVEEGLELLFYLEVINFFYHLY
jgi:hypothetical protein